MPLFSSKNGWFTDKDSAKDRSDRAKKREAQLGIIPVVGKRLQVTRSPLLEKLSHYFEGTQYDHLLPWDNDKDSDGKAISIYKRKPKVIYPFSKNLAKRIASKLVGSSVFPTFQVVDSPNDQEFIRLVIRESEIKTEIMEPVVKALAMKSCFLRFKIHNGRYVLENYEGKNCYPEWDNGELSKVTVKYVYPTDEKDLNGDTIWRWYKVEFGDQSEILYDNPEYDPLATEEPIFNEIERVDHGLGFVQGEWIRSGKDGDDGPSLVEDILEFIDELNYSLSQSSRAVAYNQDPQLIINGMTDEELGELVRSSMKAWHLGREGKAEYLETSLDGVKTATDLRGKVKQDISDLARITLLDPEKMVGAAQSAKAMEVLHGPMLDLIDEIRPYIEKQLKSLIQKMSAACVILAGQGMQVPIKLPKGFALQSLDITAKWPQVFKLTFKDLLDKVRVAREAADGNIISRKTATRFVADDFGVEDVDAEHAEIASQPVFNPFGGF